MNYTTQEVKDILMEILERCSVSIHDGGPAFFFKNDNLPPRVLLESQVVKILDEIMGRLE